MKKGFALDFDKNVTGSIQPKDGNLYLVVGCYDVNGKRQRPWIPTGLPEKGGKREAEKRKPQLIQDFIEQKRKELQRDVLEVPELEDNTFAAFAQMWIESKMGIEKTTWEKYHNIVANHIVPYFKAKKLKTADIKPIHIKQYFIFKSTNGRLDGKEGGLKYATLIGHHSVLVQIFKEAIMLEEATTNPAEAYEVVRDIEDSDDDLVNAVFLSQDEANEVLSIFAHDMIHPMIVICLYYGLRKSEVLGLKWAAIDFKNDTMSILSTVVKHSTIVEKDRTKSKKSRATYYLLPEVKELLLRVRQEQKKNRKNFGTMYVESDYVFTWPDGHMIRPDWLYHHFTNMLDKAGFQHMRFHDLRHTCCSLLYEKGWNVKDIQEWMRHSNIKTTMNIYTHLSKKRKKLLAKNLENTFIIAPRLTVVSGNAG